MSRIRHEMRKPRKAKGGVVYSGAGSNVVQEATQKRRGGPVKSVEMPGGQKPKPRMDKRPRRAAGGKVISGPAAEREMARMERDSEKRGPRKAGGGYVGTDRQPFSSAAAAIGGDPGDERELRAFARSNAK